MWKRIWTEKYFDVQSDFGKWIEPRTFQQLPPSYIKFERMRHVDVTTDR